MNKSLAIARIIIWMVVGVMASLVLISAVATDNGFFDGNRTPWYGGIKASPTNEELVEGSVNDIIINWVSGDINIVKNENSKAIRVVQEGRIRDGQQMLVNKIGDALHIEEGKKHVFNLFYFGSDLTVYLPEKIYNLIQINTVAGDIGGNIECKVLEVEAISSDITVDGDIKNVKINTVSGDIKLSSVTMLESFAVATVSGDITLTIPENSGFSSRFSKMSGDFSTNFDTTKTGNTYVYKNGTAKFTTETVSGDMRINRRR